MKDTNGIQFTLDNFEGPLALLYLLVQKSEINVQELALSTITQQFIKRLESQDEMLDEGADFISTTAALIRLKSFHLLPRQQIELPPVPQDEDPHFEVIHHLVDYCRFKNAAQSLVAREIEQASFYPRGSEGVVTPKKSSGLQHLTLSDLAGLFKEIALKASAQKGVLHEEEWKVSDKLASIRKMLNQNEVSLFDELFSFQPCRMEVIVTFLAVLELMKLGEIIIMIENGVATIRSPSYA